MAVESTSTRSNDNPPSEREIPTAVVNAVADAEGTSPLELPPLAEVVDPDALQQLAARSSVAPDTAAVRVEFAYSGHRVAVCEDGTVELSPLDSRR